MNPFLIFVKTFPSPKSSNLLLLPSIQRFRLTSDEIQSLKLEYRTYQRRFHPDLALHQSSSSGESNVPSPSDIHNCSNVSYKRGVTYLSSHPDPSHILTVSNSTILSRRGRQDTIINTILTSPRWSEKGIDEGEVREGLNEEVFEVTMELGEEHEKEMEENEGRMRVLEEVRVTFA
jgi:hypothetical protein